MTANLFARSQLALLAAEDGELEEADGALGALITELELARARQKDSASLSADLCRCLLDRASVRRWAMRPKDALVDLEAADALLPALGSFTAETLRVSLLGTRARLRAQPHSPVHDAAAAQADIAELRLLAHGGPHPWMADAIEMGLAQSQDDWPRVLTLALGLVRALQGGGHERGAHAAGLAQARALVALGRHDEAGPPAKAAHHYFDEHGPPELAAWAGVAFARARRVSDDWPLVLKALALADHQVRAQRSLFAQQRLLVDTLRLYDEVLRWLLEADDATLDADALRTRTLRAWSVAERAKSFSLRQAMTQGGFLRKLAPALADRLDALDRRIDMLEARSNDEPDAAHQLAALASQRLALLEQAMRDDGRLRALDAPAGFDVANRLQALPKGTGAVSWYWLRDGPAWRLQVFHCGADREPRRSEVAWSDDEWQALVRSSRALVGQPPFFIEPPFKGTVSAKLLPPAVCKQLADCTTLMLTPHRALRQLPLHTLRATTQDAAASDTWVFERWAVHVLPTLALPWPSSTEAGVRGHGQRTVLLAGCVDDAFGHPLLHEVAEELASLDDCWQQAGAAVTRRLLAADASLDPQSAPASWANYDVVHLACHGGFSPERPLDATLYLGRDAVRAHELFAVTLRADVVSLSACDLGQHTERLDGIDLVGDEWLGLAMPLFQAGARHVLSSLWQADSVQAVSFMARFHGALAQGQTPAAAHRAACLAHMHDDFGFWAHWQLAGFGVDHSLTLGDAQ